MSVLAQYRYSVTFDEFEEAYQLFLKERGKKHQISFERMFPILAAIWTLSAIVILLGPHDQRFNPAIIGFLVAGLWFLVGHRFQQRRLRRKQWMNQLDQGTIDLAITLTLEEEEVSFLRGGHSEARFYWSAILGIYESEQMIDLQVSENMFYWIPKRCIDETGQQLLRLQVSSKRTP